MLLAFATFLPAYAYDYGRHEGFVWDDDDHYLLDHLVQADDGWWRIWLDPQPGIVSQPGVAVVWNYWPLTRTSFWIERRLWGTDPQGRPRLLGSHLVNVALHAANAVLLVGVLRGLGLPGAGWAGRLFAVHPVTVESVAWITQRKALLSTLCFLASLALWLRFLATGRPRWYLLTSFAFLLALMAKTTTVMFPVVLVLIHAWQGRPWSPRALLRVAPFFAMSLVAGVTSIVFERFILDNLAAMRMNQGRLAEAESLLRRALEVEPRHPSALERLARLYQRQGRPEAIAPFQARAGSPAPSRSGRRVALWIWLAMSIALAACTGVAAVEARRGPGTGRAFHSTRR